MPRAVLLALISLSLIAAGCGGGAGSGGDDPAGAVPANAAFYVEATVRPEGDQRDDALDAAGKVLRSSDPQAKIDELVAKAFAETDDPKFDYEKDVAPWLGEKVGIWGSVPAGEDEEFRGAVVATVDDEDKAQSAIDRAVESSEKPFNEREYKGVDYKASSEGAAGLVEGFAVLGTEPEFKRTVDAVKGDGLASDDRYRKAMDGLDENRLASAYVDFKSLVQAGLREDPEAAQQFEQIKRLFAIDKIGPIAAGFVADGDKLAVDTQIEYPDGSGGGSLGALSALYGAPSKLVGELPGDAWLALGSPKAGQTFKTLYEQVAGAFGGAAIENQLRQQLGLDLQQDVFSWIGDIGVFARGTDMQSIDGGVVIEVIDADKAKTAFGKLVGLAQSRGGVRARPVKIDGADAAFEATPPGAPKPVVAARTDERVVIAFGREAAADALGGGDRFADSETYGAAKSVLGDVQPGLVLSLPAVLALVESSGSADEDFQKAKPYLEAFGVVATGFSRDGDREHARYAAQLK